ncbi:hypothetical protein TNCV_2790631 [Trichonephila clavipes]|nr:hypothetical protein TNCV_2790631 [Trichonephila clavipes]
MPKETKLTQKNLELQTDCPGNTITIQPLFNKSLIICILEEVYKGKSSAKVSCGVMILPTLSQRFNKKASGLDTAIETVATVSMRIAAKEAKDINGHSVIPVAIDST